MAALEATFRLHITGPEPGPVRIAAEGELDSAGAPTLLEAVRDVIAGGRAELTLDLTALAFIDSTGMRTLIEVEREAAQQGIDLRVLPPPGPVTELLQLAGVGGRLRLRGDGRMSSSEVDYLERTDLDLPTAAHAPAMARAAIRELLEGAVDAAVLAGVVLLTSELVTNAVLHPHGVGESTVGLRMAVFPGFIRVEVDDPGPGFDPTERFVDEASLPGPGEGGRGLFIVDRTATRWGSRRHQTDRGERFSVWFEVETA